MALSNDKVERISFEIIKVLYCTFAEFRKDVSAEKGDPFHAAFLNAFTDKLQDKVPDVPFSINFSRWLHGLNASLRHSFFENVGHILSDGESREYSSRRSLTISRRQMGNVNNIVSRLSSSSAVPHLDNENKELFIDDDETADTAVDFSADIFIEDDTQATAIALKSDRPKFGDMRNEKQKILEGKAALFNMFPDKEIRFFIGFPFDPTNETTTTTFDKARLFDSIEQMKRFFAESEVLVAGEFWDFLSEEESTTDQLLETINNIATTEFLAKFGFLTDEKNKELNVPLYKQRLTEWNLHSEAKLVDNEARIKTKTRSDTRLTRGFNQPIFDFDGNYNISRFRTLKELI